MLYSKEFKAHIDYTHIKGIDIFLELRSTRVLAGRLNYEKNKYVFTYEAKYLDHKKAIPVGPELPMTRQSFESVTIFPSFLDRIPSKHNPAYPEYCAVFDVASEEKDILVLLATVGRKGPSSFIFEPVWADTFSASDLKRFRKALGLSTRDFAACFGMTQAAIVRIEGGKSSGAEILRTMEIFHKFPEAAAYHVRKYATTLHSKTKEKVVRILSLAQ